MPDQAATQSLIAELHSVNTKIQVIAQRMKIIERNEEVIGKTLISHNKIIKELEEAAAKLKAESGAGPRAGAGTGAVDSAALADLQKAAQATKTLAEETAADMNKVKSEIKELRYVLENFNPLAYVTTENVIDLIDEKLEEALQKKTEKK